MAIKINKRNLNNSDAIKDNKGFTFILEDNIEGFGFISLTENDDIIVTVIAVYTNEIIDSFSTLINAYDDVSIQISIKDFLEECFECDATFIKEYKQLENMNITVDLEVA